MAAVMKHDQKSKKQVREKRVYLVYSSISLFYIEGSQDRNSNRAGSWRQELMQKSWKGAAYCLSYGAQDHKGGTTHNGWALPH